MTIHEFAASIGATVVTIELNHACAAEFSNEHTSIIGEGMTEHLALRDLCRRVVNQGIIPTAWADVPEDLTP